jgi:peroxiredoxin
MFGEFDREDVEILMVDVRNMKDETSELATDYDLSVPILLDDKRAVGKTYDVMYTPTTVILDRDGRAVFRHVGFSEGDGAMLDREVRLLLNRT